MQIDTQRHHGGAPRYEADTALPAATTPTGLLSPRSLFIALGGILIGVVIATAALGAGGALGEQDDTISSQQQPAVPSGPASNADY